MVDEHAGREALVAALEERNARMASVAAVVSAYARLSTTHRTLQEDHVSLKQRVASLHHECNELRSDVKLLQENEANHGVSSVHIERLQEKIAVLENELGEARKAADTKAAEAKEAALQAKSAREAQQAGDVARQSAVSAAHNLRVDLEDKKQRITALQKELDVLGQTVRDRDKAIAGLQQENSSLLDRYMAKVSLQAEALNSDVGLHDQLAMAYKHIEELTRREEARLALEKAPAPAGDANAAPAQAPATSSAAAPAL